MVVTLDQTKEKKNRVRERAKVESFPIDQIKYKRRDTERERKILLFFFGLI